MATQSSFASYLTFPGHKHSDVGPVSAITQKIHQHLHSPKHDFTWMGLEKERLSLEPSLFYG